LKATQKQEVVDFFLPKCELEDGDKRNFFINCIRLIRDCRNSRAHNPSILTLETNNAIHLKMLKKTIFLESNIEFSKFLTASEHKSKFGKNDLFAMIISIYALLNADFKIMFLEEIIYILDIFASKSEKKFELLLYTLNLPENIRNRIELLLTEDSIYYH